MALRSHAPVPKAAIPTNRSEPAPRGSSAGVTLRIDGAPSDGWLVECGRLDLFAVSLAKGEPGRRHPLCSIEAGGLILPIPGAIGHMVIGIGQHGAAVARMNAADLAARPITQQAALIDRWITEIAAGVFGETAGSADDVITEPGESVALVAGQVLRAPRRAVWVIPRRGRLLSGYGGGVAATAATVSSAMPIVGGLQLRAEADSAVDCMTTEAALAAGLGTRGLKLFQRAVAAGLVEHLRRHEAAGGQRIAARAVIDRLSIEDGLRQLAGVVGAVPQPSAHPPGGSPAVAALSAVADYLGVAIGRIPRSSGSAETTLRAAARANGIGLRKVLLRDEWWRTDNGVLFAWRGEVRRPVALLPVGHRGYRLWDPAENAWVRVDAAVAGEIAAHAMMAYRPMPERIAGIVALLGFAVGGLGDELATIFAMSLAAGASAALLPLATGYLFGSVIPRAEISQTLAVVLGLLLVAFGTGAFELTRAIGVLRLEGRLEMALQPALMLRLLGLPANFFRGFGSGELMNRVLSIQAMRRLIAGNTLVSVLSALFGLTSLIVILFYSAFLAIFAAAVVAVAGVVTAALALLELRQERARVALRGQEDGLLVQILQGIAKLRVAAGEARVYGVWAALFAQQKRRFLAAQRYAAASEVFGEVFPILALLALFFAASRLLAPEKSGASALGLGAFLAINAAFGQLLAATVAMARALATTLELVPLFERVRPILSALPEARADKSEAAPVSGRIELSGVSFRYAAGTRLVLDDISLRIDPGSFVALVGPSGSGKSTLLRLLLGFETAENGDILYDGQSLTTLDTGSLRRQIGVVLQHCRLTTGSIFENITNGLPYTLDDAWAAARLAGIAADIEAMPMGMHTLLMEGSATISGGQRQRLMIARALIGRPRILLFDEATSALDNRSQAIVMQSLERLSATRVVIAHRLSTVERADRIYVLERGRIVESGSFAELIAADGPFSRLARRQTL